MCRLWPACIPPESAARRATRGRRWFRVVRPNNRWRCYAAAPKQVRTEHIACAKFALRRRDSWFRGQSSVSILLTLIAVGEPIRRVVQRQVARRVPGRRAVRQPARGAGAHRGLADRVQHEAPAQQPALACPGCLRRALGGSATRWTLISGGLAKGVRSPNSVRRMLPEVTPPPMSVLGSWIGSGGTTSITPPRRKSSRRGCAPVQCPPTGLPDSWPRARACRSRQ